MVIDETFMALLIKFGNNLMNDSLMVLFFELDKLAEKKWLINEPRNVNLCT